MRDSAPPRARTTTGCLSRPPTTPARVRRGVAGSGFLLASIVAGTAAAEAPPDYASNLELVRSASPRNTTQDDSPWRDTPQRALVRENFLGPRTDYLGPADTQGIFDGGNERAYPVPEGGQFRIACEFSHFAYDDPLVHWGKPGAAHLHMFWGNTDVNAYSTYETLIDSGSSTCNGQEINRTGYWAPAMIDASGNARIPMKIIVYYKGYGQARGESEVYPKGAAMIAEPNLHTVSAAEGGVEYEKTFQCATQFRGGRSPQGNTIPRCTGTKQYVSTLEMHVKFPNCLIGDDPADPASWRTSASGDWYRSDCADGLTTPNIEYIIMYPLGDGETTDGWYLSSDVNPMTRVRDRAPGSSSHADWWGGWEPGVNREWLDECTNFVTARASGCGMGYLTDGGPDSANPLPGPALKLRTNYDDGWTPWGQLLDPSAGDYKVPVASLHEQLCPGGERIDTAEAGAYCRPAGHAGHGGDGPMEPGEPAEPTEPAPPVDLPTPPDGPATGLPAGSGLSATYFDDEYFAEETGRRVDARIDFDFETDGLPVGSGVTESDTFSVGWNGYLLADRDETVTLWTRSDDGVRVYLDGELVIDNWIGHAPTRDEAEVTLEAGRAHAIAVQYYERFGGAEIRLGWTRPGRGDRVIGTRYLHPEYPL